MRAEGRINNSRPISECVLVNEKLIEFIRTAAETSQGIASGCGSALCVHVLCARLVITMPGDMTWHGPQHYCQYLCSVPVCGAIFRLLLL